LKKKDNKIIHDFHLLSLIRLNIFQEIIIVGEKTRGYDEGDNMTIVLIVLALILFPLICGIIGVVHLVFGLISVALGLVIFIASTIIGVLWQLFLLPLRILKFVF
jgi:hypothetical protein